MKKAEYKTSRTFLTVYEDGTFEGIANNKPITSFLNEKGYVCLSCGPYHGRLHRIIWALFHPEHKLLPTEDIHHINGIKTDNSLKNLQCIDHTEHAILTTSDSDFRQMMSDRWKDPNKNPNKDRTQESIDKMKETKRKNPWHPTEETYQKWQEARTGRGWYNNGEIERWIKGEIPEGYVPGRIPHHRRTKQELLQEQ